LLRRTGFLRGRKGTSYIVGMREERSLRSVSDDELLHRLARLIGASRRAEAEIVAHIAELCCGRTYVA
jgi:hypothetical protein